MSSCSLLRSLGLASLTLSLAALTGCGMGPTAATEVSGTLHLQGAVRGGQQGVSSAQVRLYAAGHTGNGSAATDLLTQGVPGYVSTDAVGNFSITGDYACLHSTDPVYIVASGGNPGLTPAVNNQALVLVAALGSCGNLLAGGANTTIVIDEVTTVAAAWALAPFATSATNVGASATNLTGLTNAFANAQLLASYGTGLAATLPSGQTVETAKLYALADTLAPCINSDGGSIGCGPLFSAATNTRGVPADTFTAALDIVKSPFSQVSNVFKAMGTTPPFPTTYTQPPNDWTMSLSLTSAYLYEPNQLALDSAGNVFVANYNGSISGFSPQGAPLPGSPYGLGVLSETLGFTVDSNNNLWATNEENPNGSLGSVSGFYGITSGQTLGSPILNSSTSADYFYENSIAYPESLGADSSGDILIGNYYGSDASIYKNGSPVCLGTGNTQSCGYFGYGYSSFPEAVASDGAGGLWLANSGDSTVAHVGSNARILSHPTCCNTADGIAVDNLGNAFVANYGSSSLSEISPLCDSNGVAANPACTTANNVVEINQATAPGLSFPSSLHLDAAQTLWFTNFYSPGAGPGSFNAATASGGSFTFFSPFGLGLDAALTQPYAIAPDASGNLWVSSYGSAKLVMFFGLATPTATPTGAPSVAP